MPDTSINDFRIAESNVRIIFNGNDSNNMLLISSFEPFRTRCNDTDDFLSVVTIDDDLRPIPKERRERIRDFETGNGNTIVDKIDTGGYQYIIKDIKGNSCCLLVSNKDFSECKCALNGNYHMRCFGITNALMMIFAFAGSYRQTLFIHASLVRKDNIGYAFIAKSGTGKSTQVSMWLKHIPGCDLMNDDNPIIRIINDDVFIYGSPWSGKTPCYRNVKAKLGAITQIDRASKNSIERLSTANGFAYLLQSCSSMRWDKDIFNNTCEILSKLIEKTPIYILHCLPDKESAEICYKMVSK